jgi:hypothetical protein
MFDNISLSSGKVQKGIIGAIFVAFLAFLIPNMFEDIASDENTVIQSPISGELAWYFKQGVKYQGFGQVTRYHKRLTFWFSNHGHKEDGLSIRFADGGHATMYGSVQFALPEDASAMTAIYSAYRGDDAVMENLIKTVVNKSVYLSGTLLTSRESYSEKKNDLIHYVTDQIQNGVYRTHLVTTWVKDELTGQNKETTKAEIIIDPKTGLPERQEESVLSQFHIKAYNFAIDNMPYDERIEQQIRNQQQITMDVQTKIAEAKKADQQALTAEAEGRAEAAKAKWAQETIKAQKTTEADQQKQVAITNADKDRQVAETQAQQRLNVATLDRQAAEQTKQEQILLGEGEASRRKAVLAADGALAQKLDAYIKVNQFYADAIKDYRGDLVPRIVSGGSTGPQSGGNAISQFMDLQNMRAAKDLSLDMTMDSGNKR